MTTRALASVTIFLSCWLMAACGRPASEPEIGTDDPVWIFDLSHSLPESKSGGGFFSLPQKRTYLGTLEALDKAEKAEHVKGVFVRLGTGTPSWSHAEELGRRFAALRGTGRPVLCHADGLNNRTLWLAAAACSEIWLSPGASVDTVGLGGQALYFRGLLERLNVKAEFLHMGKYKSAAEMFTESGPTAAAQESMQSLLGSMRTTWRQGLLEHRSDPRAADAAENGPWMPQAALAIGLVDAIGFESDAREKLAQLTGTQPNQAGSVLAGNEKESVSPLGLVFRLLTESDEPKKPHIAVLPAVGAISYTQGGPIADETIAATSFVRAIRRLREDDSVRAVVLRIDSPGGSALASDLIWHELRRLGSKKPLVASVGDVAASGGYYLASAAQHIWAERTSIVGSIGVIGGKFTIGEALAEYGVTSHTFTPDGQANEVRVAYTSPFTEWDDATRERVREQMAQIYDLFVERVAAGRNMPREAVEGIAEGRVWTGAQGKELGLVDELGGLSNAIAMARERASLAPDVPVIIDGEVDPLKELLGLSDDADDETVRLALAGAAGRSLTGTPTWMAALSSQDRRHLYSLMPLLGHEQVIAVMPFAVKLP